MVVFQIYMYVVLPQLGLTQLQLGHHGYSKLGKPMSYSGNVSIVLTWYLISTKEMEGENYSPRHLQHSRRKKIGQVEVLKNEVMGGYCHHPLEADTTLNPVLLKAPRARYCSRGSPPSYPTYPPRISLKPGT